MNRTQRRAKPTVLPRIAPWLAMGALVTVALLAWNSARSKEPVFDGSTATVVRGDVEDLVSALGSLQPREYVDVGTQVSGQLRSLRVGVGDPVKAGSLVAELDSAVFSARVEAANATLRNLDAQIEERRAQHALAARLYERNTALLKEEATSQEAVDSSLAALRVGAAQVSALEALRQQTLASMKIDHANLGYTRIYAPIDGTVVSLGVRQGQTLNASQQAPTILRVANLDAMTVVAQVSEADVVRLRPGMEVYFNTLGWPERRWSARLRQILPTPETLNNVVLYNVLFEVDNPEHRLKPQMSAQVFFVLGRARQALLVPMAALKPARRSLAGALPDGAADESRAPGQRSYSARVMKDGRVQERTVVVGVSNRLVAQVVSGLEEGEQVVLGTAAAARRDGKAAEGSRRAGRAAG